MLSLVSTVRASVRSNHVSFQLYLTETFAGTAGVWRVSAISEAGRWKDRTTVEDMDLAVRVSLKGWQFLYVGDIRVCLLCNFPMDDSSICIFAYAYTFYLLQ